MEAIKQRLKDKEIWKRGLYMLFFIIAYSFSKFLIILVILFQFVALLIVGKTNDPVLKFGQDLSTYLYQIVLFLTFNSEQRPFPFGFWPDGVPDNTAPRLEEERVDPPKENP